MASRSATEPLTSPMPLLCSEVAEVISPMTSQTRCTLWTMSFIVLPKLLTVGAVDLAGDEAGFTSYGPTVKAHANGYQVVS
jgi:hypothetical protein